MGFLTFVMVCLVMLAIFTAIALPEFGVALRRRRNRIKYRIRRWGR